MILQCQLSFETIAEREKDLPNREELKDGKRRLAFLDLLLDMKRDGVLSADDVAEETDTFMFEVCLTVDSVQNQSRMQSTTLIIYQCSCELFDRKGPRRNA